MEYYQPQNYNNSGYTGGELFRMSLAAPGMVHSPYVNQEIVTNLRTARVQAAQPRTMKVTAAGGSYNIVFFAPTLAYATNFESTGIYYVRTDNISQGIFFGSVVSPTGTGGSGYPTGTGGISTTSGDDEGTFSFTQLFG